MEYAPVDKKVILETFQTYLEVERKESLLLFTAIDDYVNNAPWKAKLIALPLLKLFKIYVERRAEVLDVAKRLVEVTLTDERDSNV